MTPTNDISRRGVLVGAASFAAAATGGLGSASADAFGIEASRFGILPDTAADQTAAIQRALDETRITGTPLFLPPGRYLARGLVLGSGAGLVGVPGASRLTALGGAPLITATGATRASLEGLVLDGMARDLGGAQALVEMTDVDTVDIAGCRIENSGADGLYLEGCSGRVTGTAVTAAFGAAIFSLDGRALEIAGNRIADCADNGILVWQSTKHEDGARIRGNDIARIHNRSGGDGPWGNGIVVFRGGGVTISDNRITDCTFSAIRINSGSNVIVSDNNCARLGEVAIFVEFAFDGAVVANNLVDGAAHGISVTNFDKGGRLAVVSGNLVRNISFATFPERRGDGIFVSADTSLTGNVVENVARAGYVLGYGPYLRDVVATGNIVRKAKIGFAVSVVEGVKSTVIADNLISDASEAAILGMRWEEAATGDLAEAGAEAFPELTIEGNRVS